MCFCSFIVEFFRETTVYQEYFFQAYGGSQVRLVGMGWKKWEASRRDRREGGRFWRHPGTSDNAGYVM